MGSILNRMPRQKSLLPNPTMIRAANLLVYSISGFGLRTMTSVKHENSPNVLSGGGAPQPISTPSSRRKVMSFICPGKPVQKHEIRHNYHLLLRHGVLEKHMQHVRHLLGAERERFLARSSSSVRGIIISADNLGHGFAEGRTRQRWAEKSP